MNCICYKLSKMKINFVICNIIKIYVAKKRIDNIDKIVNIMYYNCIV